MENFYRSKPTYYKPKKEMEVFFHMHSKIYGNLFIPLVFVVIYLLAYFIFNGLLSFLIPGGGDYQNEVMRVMNDFVEDKKYTIMLLQNYKTV
jgi:hypothetical protein